MSVDSTDGEGGDSVLDAAIDVDDDEYVRRRRLKAINDARERAAKMPAKTWSLVVEGQLGQDTRELMIFSAVQAFIREVRPSLEVIDGGQAVLEDEELGLIGIRPPSGSRAVSGSKQIALVGVDSTLGPYEAAEDGGRRAIVPVGLQFVLESPGRFQSTWRAERRNHTKADSVETVTSQQTIPEAVSMAAFDLAVDALRDTDLSINAERDRDEYQQEYAQLADSTVSETTNGHH